MVARVRVNAGQRRGCVFAPMHWSDEFAGAARVNALVAPNVDPISGQPESKQTPVSASPYAAAWRGFALTRERLALAHDGYWALGRGEGHWRQELAGLAAPAAWEVQARAWLGDGGDWLAFRDPAAGRYRFARLTDGRLDACLFVGSDVAEIPRAWLGGLFALETLSPKDRLALLSGRAADGRADAGPLVCACFGVGEREIDAAIAAGAADVEAVGAKVKAGTNCGSCKSEIARRLRPVASAA
jgi:assimilatory nitrate reductase catalytic subunit